MDDFITVGSKKKTKGAKKTKKTLPGVTGPAGSAGVVGSAGSGVVEETASALKHKCLVLVRSVSEYGLDGEFRLTPSHTVDGVGSGASGGSGEGGGGGTKHVPIQSASADPQWGTLHCFATQFVDGVVGAAGAGFGAADPDVVHQENIIHMYYQALQALVYAVGFARSAAERERWANVLVDTARAFRTLHAATRVPGDAVNLFQQVSLALATSDDVDNDVMKCLAFVFVPEDVARSHWTKECRLQVLTSMLRRMVRSGNKARVDTNVLHRHPGPFAAISLVDVLRQGHAHADAARHLCEQLESRFPLGGKTLGGGGVGGAGGAGVAVVDSKYSSLQMFTIASGCELTLDQARGLLHFCTDARVDSWVGPDWREWGVSGLVPEHALAVPVATSRYVMLTSNPLGLTGKVRLMPLTETRFKAVAYLTKEWAAFEVPGFVSAKYSLSLTLLNDSVPAGAVTSSTPLAANLRVTTGNVLFPTDRDGYSVAGQRFSRDKVTNVWQYSATEPMSLLDPMHLVVIWAGVFTLSQNGTTYFHSVCAPAQKTVLIAFKNAAVDVDITVMAR
jgi:hypothetical protein